MTKIPVRSVWQRVVNYYYAEIQPQESKYTIWKWIEAEYNGYRRVNRETSRASDEYLDLLDYDFVFEHDTDATAFKLKFMTYKAT